MMAAMGIRTRVYGHRRTARGGLALARSIRGPSLRATAVFSAAAGLSVDVSES